MEGKKIAKIGFLHCAYCWLYCYDLDDKLRHESLFCDVAKRQKKSVVASGIKSLSIEGFGKICDGVAEKIVKDYGKLRENHCEKGLNKEEMEKFNAVEEGLAGKIGSGNLFEGDGDVNGAPYTVVVEAVEVSRLELNIKKRKLG